jgi:hypothetical protein
MEKNKERGLVLPKAFIESYLEDLDQNEKLEMISIIFHWFLNDEIPVIENKVCKVLFNNLHYFLQTSKKNYENGEKGGAPKGNQNAKKTTTKTTETTPLVLENNPPCYVEQPPLKNETSLKEEKRKEEKRKEEKTKENKVIEEIDELDMFSPLAQKLADQYLKYG